MATDQSPPRNRVIWIVAVATVVALFALKFVFDSYFLSKMESEVAQKVLERPADERKEMEIEQRKILSSGQLSVDTAIKRIHASGRSVFEAVVPKPSNDLAALEGWKSPTPPEE